jgi:hypothetical protein
MEMRNDMDKKTAHRKAEKAYRNAIELDLKRAIFLLQKANPENRAWVEARDAFLEEMNAFVEPQE